jgi:hypothetical protein
VLERGAAPATDTATPYSLDVPYRANLAATESPRLRQVSKEQITVTTTDMWLSADDVIYMIDTTITPLPR